MPNMLVKRPILNLLFVVFLVSLIWLSSMRAHAQTKPQVDLTQKNVLILYSEDKAHPAHELTDRGIRSAFSSNKLFEVRLYYEYLDGSRFKDPAITHAYADYLRRKYAGLKIDVIIAVYWKALDFLLKEAVNVFPKTPIVVTQLTRAHAEDLENSLRRSSITGTVFGDNIADFLAAVFQLRPGTKRVALVGGINPSELYTEKLFRKGLEPYLGKLELVDLTRLPMQEILSRVSSLPPDTVVFFSNMFTDGAGKNFVPREALALISRTANAPVFGLFDSYLGYGIVGGWLVSFEGHGREAAALAIRIMGGQPPVSIPFSGEQAFVSAYDWQQLRRWNLSEDTLPKGSVVINKEPTLWDFRYYITGVLVFFLAETALILILFAQRRRKKAAEIKYQSVFEGAVEGVFEISVEGKCMTANPAMARILGYDSAEEVCSKITNSANQVWVDPDERALYTKLLEEQNVVLGFKTQFWRKDRTKIWVSIKSRRVPGPHGKTLFYSGFVEDITDRQRAEKEALKARRELWGTDRLLRMGELTASLAHELNQPLTSILSNAQAAIRFIKSDRVDMKELVEILEDIAKDDKRAGDIIRSLRSMVKPEEGEREVIYINDLLDETIALFNSEAIIRNIRIETKFADLLPTVEANKIQLEQVVINLLMNAAESMVDANENRKIVVETNAVDGDKVRVTIRDYGTGIDEQELSGIFEPFFTTKRSGLGMGLSLGRSIIEGHAGRIWAENNSDGGATFYFELPGVRQ